jgi:putative phage-type endonuclease
VTHDQRSDEWYAERLGKFTASAMGKLMAKGAGKTRDTYLRGIRYERECRKPASDYTNAAMERGIELEAEARLSYELVTGRAVTETGFVPHPELPFSGASPDGLVGDDGLVEIKCPGWDQHIRTRDGEPPKRDYLLQMQWQMACCERQWCDFVSYHPDFPTPGDMLVIRVERDDALIAELRQAVEDAEAEVLAALDGSIPGLDDIEEGAA